MPTDLSSPNSTHTSDLNADRLVLSDSATKPSAKHYAEHSPDVKSDKFDAEEGYCRTARMVVSRTIASMSGARVELMMRMMRYLEERRCLDKEVDEESV